MSLLRGKVDVKFLVILEWYVPPPLREGPYTFPPSILTCVDEDLLE